jgi:hypothetical protein
VAYRFKPGHVAATLAAATAVRDGALRCRPFSQRGGVGLMVNVVATLLAAALFLLGASQFQQQGYFVVDQVCARVYGACDHPIWLAIMVAVLFFGVVLTRPKS